MTDSKKNTTALSTSFGVMLLAATAAHATHLPAVGVWTVTTGAGWVAARVVYGMLEHNRRTVL